MSPRLRREIGVGGAVLLGLGSILGTGVFVSSGIAAGVAGPGVIVAVGLAALVATCNALSSAQLAASHPVSGGTYEYGYRYLTPRIGFSAGWMFLCAKSASAATAALGFAGYVLDAFGPFRAGHGWRAGLGVGAVLVLTLLVAGGIRRSNRTNAVIVALTLVALLAFILAGLPLALARARSHFVPFPGPFFGPGAAESARALLEATALMFVAFTGYGRIATLGEEVHDPARTIPRAIVITLLVSALLYVGVTFVAVGAAGADAFAAATRGVTAPLEVIARGFSVPLVAWLVSAGAITAMLGVLLNLILGLSRVVLAMSRRGDLPSGLARIDEGSAAPRRAVLGVGAIIAVLALIGDVELTWSFSAFTVLVYYACTNLAALRLPAAGRRYPRWIAVAGLVACASLAFWVDTRAWASGLALLAVGLLWHQVARRRSRPR
ncbi:MAG TPA: APC family permease [Haliangium sp.]|nr:APC family permease [Haliangium sp.]